MRFGRSYQKELGWRLCECAPNDSRTPLEQQFSNAQKSLHNTPVIEVELDRLTAKLQVLTETAIAQDESYAISSQVDSIAQSMAVSCAEMRELEALTGFVDDAVAPKILEPPTIVLGGPVH